MSKIFIFLPFLLLNLNASQKAVVLDLKIISDISGSGVLSQKLRSLLSQTGKYDVIDVPVSVDKSGNSNTFSKECDNKRCARSIAEASGATIAIWGSIGKAGETFLTTIYVADFSSDESIIKTFSDEIEGSISDVLKTSLNNIVMKIAQGKTKVNLAPKLNTKTNYGALVITSTPHDAKVFINNTEKGATPYSDFKLPPKKYSLKISLQNYEDISENIFIVGNDTLNKEYELKYTNRFIKKKKISKWIRRITFGSIAAGFGAAGFYYNKEGNKYYDKYLEEDSYNSSLHDENWDYVKKNKIIRNVMYGLAGGFSVGLLISIPF